MDSFKKIIETMMEPNNDVLSMKEIVDKTQLTFDSTLMAIESYRGLFESCTMEDENGIQTFFWLKNQKIFKSVFAAWNLSEREKFDFSLSTDEESFFDVLVSPGFSGYRSVNTIKNKTNLKEPEIKEIVAKYEEMNIVKGKKDVVGFTKEGQYTYFCLLINKIFFP
jgi:hypothetical protein